MSVDALSESGRRYRVHARTLPFTPSWFWEIIDTVQGSIVENSLALSRSVYRSSSEARAAGLRYLERAATAADAA